MDMNLPNLLLALVLSSAVTGCASSKSKSKWGKQYDGIRVTKASEGRNKGWASRYAETSKKKKDTGTEDTGTEVEKEKATPPEIPKGARDPKEESGSPRLDGEQIVIPDTVLPKDEGN